MFLLPFDRMRLISRQGPRPQDARTGAVMSAAAAAARAPADVVWRIHNGTDWANAAGETEGTPLRAGLPAVVEWADNRGGITPFAGYGNAIVLRYSPTVRCLFAHCRNVTRSPGESVWPGDVVAFAGRSSRPDHLIPHAHLHLEFVTRWPLRSDDHAARYDALATFEGAGYRLNSSGILEAVAPTSPSSTRSPANAQGTRPSSASSASSGSALR
ncbi:MAG: M23 family metallopeptidase, partial [Kiritimatiellae bacterium]|nr:M23 family metallopeptidase [Kiritimatiellia bacterium]